MNVSAMLVCEKQVDRRPIYPSARQRWMASAETIEGRSTSFDGTSRIS